MINRIRAKVKLNYLYTCEGCGKQEVGTTAHHVIEAESPAGLVEALEFFPQGSRDMPVGWHYNGVFNCGCER